jgi:hypothetical protein
MNGIADAKPRLSIVLGMKATPIAMTAEAVMINNAPVSNDNERIRFSIVQRAADAPHSGASLSRRLLFISIRYSGMPLNLNDWSFNNLKRRYVEIVEKISPMIRISIA